MTRLSAIISAYNAEEKIKACLESVSFCDEIIFVDNTSTDKTLQIAKKFTKNIFIRKNNPMLNVNKNFGFTKATGDWILCLDSDERITPDLAEEIKKVIRSDAQIAGYWIPRRNIIFNKWIQNSIWWPDYQLRLFRKGNGKFAEKHVHEMLEVIGETERLVNPMIHENYDSISQYIYKLDKIYTESEVDHFLSSGKQISWIDALRFPINDFLKTFFAQKGYKDGLHGLVLSLLQAFYAEIVFAKIWEKQGFQEYNSKNFLEEFYKVAKKSASEIHYWFFTSLINDTPNKAKQIGYKVLRKLTFSGVR